MAMILAKRLLLALVCICGLTGCEELNGGGESWTAESALPGGAPGYYRAYCNNGYHTVQIRNASNGKLHIVGVVSTVPNVRFVDLGQPGAFNLTIYPGQRGDALVDGDYNSTADYSITMQDWTVEP